MKAGTPVMPAYSLSKFELTTLASAVLTEGRTYGLPLSSPRANQYPSITCSIGIGGKTRRTVSSDTQVDLLLEGISLESFSDAQDRVL